jgi:hypothetical protein
MGPMQKNGMPAKKKRRANGDRTASTQKTALAPKADPPKTDRWVIEWPSDGGVLAAISPRLEAAFAKLLIPPHKGPGIPISGLIPSIPRSLVVEYYGNDLVIPSDELVSQSVTENELATTKRHAAALLKTLNGLHMPAIDAFSPTGYSPFEVSQGLPLYTHLVILLAAIECTEIPVLPPAAGKGRKPKRRAARLMMGIAFFYTLLTGRRPTISTTDGIASGPFLELTRDVFGIFGVDASAEAQARAFIADKEESSGAAP